MPRSFTVISPVTTAGAAFYALYVVLLKLLIKDETKLNTRRFFGTPHFGNQHCLVGASSDSPSLPIWA
jgi:hypothetical protein